MNADASRSIRYNLQYTSQLYSNSASAQEAQPSDDRKQPSLWRQHSEPMSCRSNSSTHECTPSDAISGDLEMCGAKQNQRRTDAQRFSLFIQTVTFNH